MNETYEVHVENEIDGELPREVQRMLVESSVGQATADFLDSEDLSVGDSTDIELTVTRTEETYKFELDA